MAIEASPPSAEPRQGSLVPIVDRTQASGWIKVENPLAVGLANDFLQTDLKVSSSAFAMVIESRDMEPAFQPGDKVIIDPKVEPRPGDFVVAKCDNDQAVTFKVYRSKHQDDQGREAIELGPLNRDGPTHMSDRDNPGNIVGTMVEHRRYRRNQAI